MRKATLLLKIQSICARIATVGNGIRGGILGSNHPIRPSADELLVKKDQGKSQMPFISLQLLLDPDLYNRAVTKAQSEGKSLDRCVVDWIVEWLDSGRPSLTPPGLLPLPLAPGAPAPTVAPQTYIVQPGDTLYGIALDLYGDGAKFALIAQANGLDENRRIHSGMRLTIPPLETDAPPPAPAATGALAASAPVAAGYPAVPVGLEQVRQVFGEFTFTDLTGNPTGRIEIDPQWTAANIVSVRIPALGNIECHKKMVPVFVDVFAQLERQGLAEGLSYWGCYVPRHKMWDPSQELSVHAWGIAMDLNADTNASGTAGTMDTRVVKIFEAHGFYWGGHFGDPMHFEYSRPVEASGV